MVDKCAAKKYVSSIIGEEYIIPTIGVWEKFEDIDFTILPNSFVLKTTHDSGGVILCKDKTKFDKNYARKKLNKSLKRNFYFESGSGVVPFNPPEWDKTFGDTLPKKLKY